VYLLLPYINHTNKYKPLDPPEIMGVITRERTIQEIDLHSFNPEYYNCKECGEEIQKHINQDGARYHVQTYSNNSTRCSQSDCEINHRRTCK